MHVVFPAPLGARSHSGQKERRAVYTKSVFSILSSLDWISDQHARA
jgi:hypothetical protein